MTTTECIKFLWNLLDNIDTLDDACKEDDVAFRKMAYREQRKRFQTGITTDGYTLDMSAIDPQCAAYSSAGYVEAKYYRSWWRRLIRWLHPRKKYGIYEAAKTLDEPTGRSADK